MGQRVSTAVSRATRTYQQVQRARADPSNTAGFGRGQLENGAQPDLRDLGQQKFLQQKGGPVEMPPDLVKFLQDVGPLKKRGPGSVKAKTETAADAPEVQAADHATSGRTRQSMPLASAVEGFETERTTNFSYAEAAKEDGLDVLGLYRLLVADPSSGASDDVFLDTPLDDVARLVEDTRAYLAVPVIARDSDDSLIGVHPEKLEEVQLPRVPKTEVKLVLEDLVDLQSPK